MALSLQKKGTGHLSESGMKRMGSSAMRQCDRPLAARQCRMTVSPRVKQHVAEDARRVFGSGVMTWLARGDAEEAEAAADYLPAPATAVSGCFAPRARTHKQTKNTTESGFAVGNAMAA